MIKLYRNIIVLQLKTLVEYRFSFISQIAQVLVGYVSTMIVYWMMFHQFKTLNGWQYKEIMLVYSLTAFTINLSSIFFNHFRSMDNLIVSGEFAKFMTKPHDVFLHYFISKIDLGEMFNLLITATLFVVFSVINGVEMTMVNLLFLLVAIASGVLINGACNILIGAVSFWTIKSGMLYNTILWPAQFLSYIPLVIFPKGIQFVYTYIFPLGYTGYYPATILLRKNSELTNPNLPYYAPVIALVFFAMTVVVWRIGLERFEGTGS